MKDSKVAKDVLVICTTLDKAIRGENDAPLAVARLAAERVKNYFEQTSTYK
ncbi:hypothetical protein [Furfurilactobacillus siliginis]|uniref:Uncharacterized protein n=1 Tax=Furfurilactobacillus siliginis TaxID=348151 RepID=A0A0R2L4Z9_9LACO|nr:hypothetical protein [Furfurilactobacillus siliginis]KRN96841.1 hypothetical protein IV55_GL000709 [Furfurilactobacillus siliginis]GEK28507.1 hypothetical protein LSI01_08180 [Furfurilactobacillus siliginis]